MAIGVCVLLVFGARCVYLIYNISGNCNFKFPFSFSSYTFRIIISCVNCHKRAMYSQNMSSSAVPERSNETTKKKKGNLEFVPNNNVSFCYSTFDHCISDICMCFLGAHFSTPTFSCVSVLIFCFAFESEYEIMLFGWCLPLRPISIRLY